MMAASLDLTKLLPPRYRDKTLDGLLKNLFNRHLSKDDAVSVYGYIGERQALAPGEVQLTEKTLERQVHQLTPMIYAEHATEKFTYSWADLVQRLIIEGVDYSSIGDIFTTRSYNFMPPIDLDKFCNFNEYYWVGRWVRDHPTLPYYELGIPQLNSITNYFLATNPTYQPEYYVIQRGELTILGNPVILDGLSDYTTWPEWAQCNLWVHREDVVKFLVAHGSAVNFNELIQATRPIIEYFSGLRLNTRQLPDGQPCDETNLDGSVVLLPKLRINQPPLFDIYRKDRTHAGFTSSIFYYKESGHYPYDEQLSRRVVTNSSGDYVFEHSLVDPDTEELYFYRQFIPS